MIWIFSATCGVGYEHFIELLEPFGQKSSLDIGNLDPKKLGRPIMHFSCEHFILEGL